MATGNRKVGKRNSTVSDRRQKGQTSKESLINLPEDQVASRNDENSQGSLNSS